MSDEVSSKKDAVFKTLFGRIEDTYLLTNLIRVILNKEVSIIEFKERELPIVSYREKINIVDMLVKMDNELVHIELNSNFTSYIKFRNYAYLSKIIALDQDSGRKYYSNQKYISINLSRKMARTDELLDVYKFRNEKGELYFENIQIIVANLDKAKELCYNGEKSDLVKYLAALTMTREELEKYKEEDEYMGKLAKELNKINADNVWLSTDEEDYQAFLEAERYEGREEGREEAIKETAINLLKDNVSIEKIILYTGLSKEKVEKIKEILDK